MATSTDPPSPAGSARQGFPDFFIVGHAKSGTTALYHMLRSHPQIYMPYVKEPGYFVPEFASPYRRVPGKRHPNTPDGYLALFADARPGQITGEATPSYLFSRTAAGRIAEAAPAARIVAVLREPASFLRSLHLQLLKTDVETEKDLRKALALEPRRRAGDSLPPYSPRPQLLMYSEHVRYVEQLRRYHAVFPREQVLVLIYEEFRADNAARVREVLRFLGVDDSVSIEPVEVNPATGTRAPRARELVRSLYKGRGPVAARTKAVINAITSRRVRHRAIHLSHRAQITEPPAPDEQLMAELRQRFKGEVVALGEYLGRDLVSLWGYERID